MTDEPEVFGIVAESKDDGPILWECAAAASGIEAVRARAKQFAQDPRTIRVCVVRLVYESGNELLLSDMARLQK